MLALIIFKVKQVLFALSILIYWYLEAFCFLFVPPQMKSIDGEVILVTGANGGIGSEICRYIVKCGRNIKLVMWDIDINELITFAEDLKLIGKDLNNKIFCYEVDISSKHNIEVGYELVKKECGDVTIIFNNAAVAPTGNFLQITCEQVTKTVQVNLMSHFWIIRKFLPNMVARNHGRIVNVGSVGAIWGGPHNFSYFASKFAGNGYMEALKIELSLFKYDGIHCTTAYIAFVKTPLVGSLTLNESVSLLPKAMKKFHETDKVAIKIVDGVRRQYEYIYLPSMIPVLRFLEYFVPNKLLKFVSISHVKCVSYKNQEEQRIIDAPFEPYVPTSNDKNPSQQ